MRYLIGIDMGTTNIKAILFDELGAIIAEAKCSTPVQVLDGGFAVYDPDTLWDIVAALLRDVSAQLEARGRSAFDICGIAVTGMGEAGVPLDRDGQPLYPVITWYDSRTRDSAEQLREILGDECILQITGLHNQHIFTANKLLWLRTNEPEAFSKMYRWHCVPDYISFRLTGASRIDYSLASRTMLFHQATASWSEEILSAVGISQDILPPVSPSGDLIGKVTAESAESTHIPSGIPVFTGGHDHICGAFAVGVWDAGSALDSSGTAEEVLFAANRWETAEPLGRQGFNIGHHVKKDRYYTAGGIPASGASVDWFRKNFPPAPKECRVPLAHGLLFLPHLRGSSSPDRNHTSCGCFLGLRDSHHMGDFRQAVYEGVCFEMRQMMERLGGMPERVVTIGGGTKNADWLQVKSDVLGMPVEVPSVQESTALGAALLAGLGAGLYASAEDAFRKTYRIGRLVQPDLSLKYAYDRQFKLFQQIYPTISAQNTEYIEKGEIE